MFSTYKIVKWYAKNLPIYRKRIKTLDEATEFFEGRPDLPWKVIMFHNKKNTWSVFKGLSAHFHNRLDFGEVYKSAKGVLQHFNITTVP